MDGYLIELSEKRTEWITFLNEERRGEWNGSILRSGIFDGVIQTTLTLRSRWTFLLVRMRRKEIGGR